MSSNPTLAAIRAEHAALRDRVRRVLAASYGGNYVPPPLPPAIPPNAQRPSPGGAPPPPINAPIPPGYPGNFRPGPIPPAAAQAAHEALQRALLSLLAGVSGALILPLSFDALLWKACEASPELSRLDAPLNPLNVDRAFRELEGIMQGVLRVQQGQLVALDVGRISDFRQKLTGGGGPPAPPGGGPRPPGAPPPGAAAPESAELKRKRSATAVQDDELAEVLDLVERKSEKQVQKEKETDELLELLNKRSAADEAKRNQFKTAGGSKLKEFCRNGTREECARITGGARCDHIHFRRILKPHTDVSLGDCSYLDTCRHMATCKFIHYEVDPMDAAKMRVCGDASSLDPFSRTAANKLDDDKFKRHYESQFVNCDIRTFPMAVLGKFPVIMADPPWDIHMELPYGTMADDEMRRMNVQVCACARPLIGMHPRLTLSPLPLIRCCRTTA